MKPGDNNPVDTGNGDDLRQVEQHYRALGQDEPPAMLDQAVLNTARRAVEPKIIRPWNFGWMHATATAALLVIGLTLVLQLRNEVPELPADINGFELQRAERQQNLPASADAQFRDAPAKLEEAVSPQESAAVDTLGKSDVPSEGFQASDDRTADRDQRNELHESVTTSTEDELKQSRASQRERVSKAASPERPAPEPVTAADASMDREADVRRRQDESRDEKPDPAAVAGALATAAPLPASAPARQEAEQDLAVVAEEESRMMAAEQQDPESWLEHIIELRRNPADDAWLLELEAFAETYPDYPLPAELQNELDARKQDKDGG